MESLYNGEDVMNVCRLCLGTDSLMSIFDDRIKIPENMKDVIQITTGVTISPSDDISQKLCYKCVNITIRMFKFRTSSIVNNLELKEKASLRKNKLKLHKSVKLLYINYPKIILPSFISESNISPIVSINRNDIENWKKAYRKKKALKKMKQKFVQKNHEVLERDLEKDITPYIITNNEKFPENRVTNSEAEKLVESNTLPPAPSVNENQHAATGPSSEKNEVHEVLNEIAPEKLETIENKGKRKLNLSMNKHEAKKTKLNSENHDTETSMNSLLDLKYVNECIYLCDICNNILYNIKDLKRHKNKHMRCSLCKKSFRSLRETEEHSERHCPIKNMMTNLPNILLQRCDQSDEIRKQYPSAFGIAAEENLEDLDIKPDVSEEMQDPTNDSTLISDEENDTAAPNNNPEISCGELINSNNEMTILSKEKSPIPSVSQDKCGKGKNPCSKPDLEITGENVLRLNIDDDEISLLRNILKHTKKNIKESSIQTDLPNNCDIIPSLTKDKLFEMKNLREYLNYYKIPVNVSYATQYAAKYGNDPSLVSKYHHYDWNIMKTKRKPPAQRSNDKVAIPQNKNTKVSNEESKLVSPAAIPQNTNTKVSNEESKLASPAYTIPPLFLIRTQSQTSSQALYAVAVSSVQNNTNATLTTTDSAKQTRSTPQHEKNSVSTSSEGNNCGNIRNNTIIQRGTNIQNNPIILNNSIIHNNANIRNANIRSSTGVPHNTNVRSVVSCNVLNITPPVIPKSNGQVQMNSRKSDSATPIKKSQNLFTFNGTSTNSCSKEVQNGKSLMSSPPVSYSAGVLSSTQNNNGRNGTTYRLSTSAPQAVANNPSPRTNNGPLKGRKNAQPLPHYGVNNNRVLAPATFANVQMNSSNLVNTSINSSPNSFRLPEVPVSNPFQNNFRNIPAVASHSSHMGIANTNSKMPSPNVIFLTNIQNVNNQSRSSSYAPNSNSQPANGSMLPQERNSAIPSTSFSNHMLPPPPPPVVVSQQSSNFGQRTDAFDRNVRQSTSTTASSSQNGNHFVPLIRVRNVSELR